MELIRDIMAIKEVDEVNIIMVKEMGVIKFMEITKVIDKKKEIIEDKVMLISLIINKEIIIIIVMHIVVDETTVIKT